MALERVEQVARDIQSGVIQEPSCADFSDNQDMWMLNSELYADSLQLNKSRNVIEKGLYYGGLERKDYKAYHQISKTLSLCSRQWHATENSLAEVAIDDDEHKKQKDIFVLSLINTGISLVADEQVKTLHRLAKRYDVSHMIDNAIDTFCFAVNGPAITEIEGISPRAIVNGNARKNASPEAVARLFLTTAQQNSAEDTFERYGDQQFLFQRFPQTVRQNIYSTYLSHYVAPYYSDENMPEFVFPENNKEFTQATISQMKKYINGLRDLQDDLFQRVIDPTSEGADITRKLVMEALESDDMNPVQTLWVTGVKGSLRLGELYRTAQRLSQKGDESAGFYQSLIPYLEQFAEHVFSEKICTIDEVASRVTQADDEVQNQPCKQDYSKTVRSIQSKTGQKEFAIDPEQIDWEKVTPPDEAHVAFSYHNKNLFLVRLLYKTDDEPKELELFYDISPKTKEEDAFDWTVIADPHDPIGQRYAQQLNKVGLAVLQKVESEVVGQYQQRSERSLPPIVVFQDKKRQGNKTTNENPKIEEAFPKRTKRKHRIIDEVVEENIGIDTMTIHTPEKGITYHIELPEDEEDEELGKQKWLEVGELLENLIPSDRELVMKVIHEFNTNGGRPLKKLSGGDLDGNALFSLPLYGSNKIRIIVRNAPSEKGLHKFSLYDVDYRDQIYSKRSKFKYRLKGDQ